MPHHIYHDLPIHAPIRKVFDAICLPDHLVNWWPRKCSGKPSLGATYNFYFAPEYDWYGEVVRIDKDQAFHIKVTKADTDWEPTTLGFDLKETEQGAMLSFSHINWTNCKDHFKRSSYCWAILLQGLKNYIEKGVIIPFEERA